MDNFHLDETTGELSVKSPLDFESLLSTKGELLVEVVATDFGEPPLSSAANITVRVLDENDETAKFSFDTYTASVLENSPEGKKLFFPRKPAFFFLFLEYNYLIILQ